MQKKTFINSTLLAAAAFDLPRLFAAVPSTDPRYEALRAIMRDYVQGVVQAECGEQEDFDFNAYRWDDYEISGLEVILFDILNHTKNYCKPPELTGMHRADRPVEEGSTFQ